MVSFVVCMRHCISARSVVSKKAGVKDPGRITGWDLLRLIMLMTHQWRQRCHDLVQL